MISSVLGPEDCQDDEGFRKRPRRNHVIALVIVRVQALIKHQLAKDTASLAVGQFLRLALQAIYFVTIARTLGSKQYGAFVAMAAMVAVVAPFAGMGGLNILLKNVSRDRSLLSVYWGNGLLLLLISGSCFTGIVLLCGPWFVGRDLTLALFLVCLSDLIFARIVDLSSFAFAAIGRMAESAKLNVYISLSRLSGLFALLAIVRHPSVQQWTIAYVAASTACFLYSFTRVTFIGGIRFSFTRMKQEISESSHFAVSGSATTIYNDMDKTMLARLSDFGSTGIYGAAYRLIDVSMAPVNAITLAASPEFFRRGRRGPKAAEEYAWKLIKHTAPLGFAIFLCLFIGAPILPHVLGSSFQSSVEATRWLAIIPFLRCIHVFLAGPLAGAGYQGTRASVQVGVGIINVLLNIYFISRWSWRGAAWTSVMCDSLLLIGLWVALKWACRNEERIALAGVVVSS
jgi:O-antigen/teichoic acid export membrane protein